MPRHEFNKGNYINGNGWKRTITESARSKFKNGTGTLTSRIQEGVTAGRIWDDVQQDKLNGIGNTHDLHDQQHSPIFFGSDVVGLYPNLEPTCVARIAANSIRKTRVKFRGINYCLHISGIGEWRYEKTLY